MTDQSFYLCELLQRFLLEKKSPLAAHFRATEWVVKLVHLCDIYALPNKLTSVTSRRMSTFESAKKVAAFKAKVEVRQGTVNKKRFFFVHRVLYITGY